MFFLFQLLEKEVTIRVRPQDRDLVTSIIPTIATEYKDVTGKVVHLKIDDKPHLSQDNTGGIDFLGQKNKIKISNTMEARLDLISQHFVPQIRSALYGLNVNRKFTHR
ncbi:hypothetical protein JTB14_023520 [Gonioctena quinquepunctata]|nr:hypothetical protein JTB14_023520 [Gonioctena quinquepunctata]